MKIVICDDDELFISRLTKLLNEYLVSRKIPNCHISSFNGGNALICSNVKPDLVFLDMEMPGMDGIETAHSLKANFPDLLIIVITGYDCYLDDAMACNVFRYLSKPLNRERLFRNLDDAFKKMNEKEEKIAINHSLGTCLVYSSQIIMIEYKGNTIVHTVYGSFSVTDTLEYWYQKLAAFPYFYQSHRNYIVNLKYILNFDYSHIILFFDNKEFQALLTKRKYPEFRNYFLRQ